ncbi:MAG TPA: hopanoid-associated sugar epimerase [Steroidobacteraceae bacterium]|nr:hopanoid-associated sugar epimerase [Steroidobacteraceae bacterium]
MKALVTGASGFVGSAVARNLLRSGWRVRALVRPRSDARNLQGLELERVEGDLQDPTSLRRALADCEALFHVAAEYRLWTAEPESLYRTNLQGTQHLLTAAAELGVQRIVYTSSVATLRLRGDGSPSDERDIAELSDMVGHYKRSKFLAEQWVVRAAEGGLPVVIVNPSTPVGPGDIKPTPTGRLVLDAATGRMPAYVDTGLNIVHVDDVAEGHRLAYERGRPGERYVLGGTDLTLQRILQMIAAISGRTAPRIRLPHAVVLPMAYIAEAYARLTHGDTRITVDGVRMARHHMYFSSAKAERELGFHARPPEEAFADAIRWFRETGSAVRSA